jgi:hypothetical protein
VTFKNPKPVSGHRISAPAQQPQNTDKEPPSFCLRFIVPKYCLTKCNTEQKAAFAQRLYELSRSTWVELRNAGKKGGTEVLPQFRTKEPIPTSITPDVTLVAFRYWKKAPMVGFRDGRTFYVVWLDIDFSLYDHE